MHTNRLAREKSPYLLQHAHNPVDWYPWGEEAFEKARKEDKPVFLSIGYSTCHWCHVMERESFENEDTAEVLNRLFVPVKVDREERPDIDRVYMMFVQATTGSGGWPMSVWLTPELRPFYGGTYFPPDARYGRPGFKHILESVAQAWLHDRDKIVHSGEEVLKQLAQHAGSGAGVSSRVEDSVAEDLFSHLRRGYDSLRGGFGGAPKFPHPASLSFLFRFHAATGSGEALEMAAHTLLAMARGGMYDQIGGGFHRYSVDDRWFVPHFEKMLYDQAQLVTAFAEAYQITGDEGLATIARDTIEYVLRDLRDPGGAFYSAEDADSIADPAHPHEKGEGAFYIWSDEELRALLGGDAAVFAFRHGVRPDGNVENDPQREFTGRNILFQAHSIEETAERFGLTSEAAASTLSACRQKLLAARATRIRPHLDDKILTAWNALMISGLALASRAFQEPRYRDAAEAAAGFLLATLWDAPSGRLLRRYRAGEAAIDGFLDDYAGFANALVDLYEATFVPRYLEAAEGIARALCARFEDQAGGGFYSSAEGDTSLILRLKDEYDGAEPSGNSLAVMALLRLSAITGNEEFRRSAERALTALSPRLNSQPVSAPMMVAAHMLARARPRQIVFTGPAAETLRGAADLRFLPGVTLLAARDEAERALLARWHGEIASMPLVPGQTTAYLCENFVCKEPVTTLAALDALIQS
ncbi:MAG: thioredoxin domain-containing protein [Bryobacterales bacterium]|nr:thioredoxin domain-containing protein [Bryobacterales bacterium]